MYGKELSIQEERYEGEIDLAELIGILLKNWKIVIGVASIITLISLGGALYVRSKTYDKSAVDFKLKNIENNFFYEKASLNITNIDPEFIFLKDNLINEFYDISELNNILNKNLGKKNYDIDDKRKFILDRLELKEVFLSKDELSNYQLLASSEGGKTLNDKLIKKFIEILNRERELTILNQINNKYKTISEKSKFYEGELKKLEVEMRKIVSLESIEILKNEGTTGIFEIKYPSLLVKKLQLEELYKKYSDELIGLEGLKEDITVKNQVKLLSSVYKVKNKSKALLILAGGAVLGLFMGIFVAFGKEFFKGMDFKK